MFSPAIRKKKFGTLAELEYSTKKGLYILSRVAEFQSCADYQSTYNLIQKAFNCTKYNKTK